MIWQFQTPGRPSSAIICGDDLTDTIVLGEGDLTVVKQ